MAYALVAHTADGSTTGNGFTTGTGIDTTGANLIVAALAANAAASGTFSDSNSNTWTPLTQAPDAFSDRFICFYYCENPIVGAGHTFSVTGTSTFPSISVSAWSGGTTSSFDVQNNNNNGFSTSTTTGSVTPGSANELVITALCFDDTTATINLGFTTTDVHSGAAFGSVGNGMAYLIQTTATAENPTWSWSATSRNVGIIATFKSGGAAPSSPPFVPNPDSSYSVIAAAAKAAAAIALTAGAVWVPTAPVAPPNSKPAGWYQPLSVAPPVAKAQPGYSFVPFNTPQLAPPVPRGWLSIDSKAPPLTAPQPGSTFVPFNTRQTNTVTIDKWQQPLSTPVLAPRVQYGSAFVPFNTLQITLALPRGWYAPLSTAPPLTTAQLGSFFVPFNTAQIVVTPAWGWYKPLSTAPPVVAVQPGYFFVPFNTTQFFPAPPWGWHQPLPTTPRAAQAIQSQPTWEPTAFPSFTFAWQQPLASTPARYAAQQGILSLPFVIPIPANTVTGIPWQQPLATAVRSPAAIQSVQFVPFNTAQVIITTTLIQRTLTGVGL